MAIERLKCFISYSSRDKKLAGGLKKCLTSFGLDVFLAHDDIEPSAAWVQTILAELQVTDVFLPLLTKSFPQSDWTDQETGIALGSDKLIVPLKVDVDPYGFISSIQALKIDPDSLSSACTKIARIIGKNPQRREKFLDGLIEMLRESFTFAQAGRYAALLTEFEGYTPQQVRRVLLAAVQNDQIHQSWDAQKRLSRFIDKYEGEVDPELVKKARRALK